VSAFEVVGAPAVVPRGVIARANPVAKLAVASAVALALVLTVDVVTAGVALLLEVLALPWCGIPPSVLLRRGWPVLAAAVPAAVATALLGVDSGPVLVAIGPLDVTTGSATAALAIGLRILAIGLPGVVLLATTDPTDLADALAQLLRLPYRFVLSALAAMRLVGLLAEEWQALGLARRARGLGDGGWLGRGRTVAGQVFALLVLAIRRATVLATAMEARGFGVTTRRTWARRSRFGWRDALVVVGGVLLAVVATLAGVLAGTWQLVLL
jgi:energy-coupling factor transport system permease protein